MARLDLITRDAALGGQDRTIGGEAKIALSFWPAESEISLGKLRVSSGLLPGKDPLRPGVMVANLPAVLSPMTDQVGAFRYHTRGLVFLSFIYGATCIVNGQGLI